MELLITEERFSDDLKKALGFVDADISYERLEPALEIATDELVDTITEENYAQLLHYLSNGEPDLAETEPPAEPPAHEQFDDLSENEKADFLKLVKYVLLSKAFNMYIGLGDITVSNNGRTMRRDEHTVSAFQWQIEKHDAELEQMYYRHLDRLLRFMNKHNLQINQQKYNHSDLIVESLARFEQFMDVKESYALYIRLIPALREAEKLEIFPRLGADLMEQVKADKNTELAYLVQKTIVYHALVWGFYKLELQIFPKGMLSHNAVYSVVNSRNNTETRLMRQALALNFERDLERDLITLEKMVTRINTPPPAETGGEIEYPDFGFDCNDGFVNT